MEPWSRGAVEPFQCSSGGCFFLTRCECALAKGVWDCKHFFAKPFARHPSEGQEPQCSRIKEGTDLIFAERIAGGERSEGVGRAGEKEGVAVNIEGQREAVGAESCGQEVEMGVEVFAFAEAYARDHAAVMRSGLAKVTFHPRPRRRVRRCCCGRKWCRSPSPAGPSTGRRGLFFVRVPDTHRAMPRRG